MRALSQSAGDLLLNVLEQPDCVIRRDFVEEVEAGLAEQLIAAGALKLAGHETWILDHAENGSYLRDLDRHSPEGKLGYFAGVDGYVTPDPAELSLLRLNFNWWQSWLASTLNVVGRPVEILPQLAWDLGDLWITPKRKVPVIFVRRLGFEEVQHSLLPVLQLRKGRAGGIILTSSQSASASFNDWPGGHQRVSIRDVIASGSENFEIDADLVTSPFCGISLGEASAGPIHLSPDGRVLIVNGETLLLRGQIQIHILKQLAGTLEGTPLPTSQVLEKAGSSADSLAKAFRGNPNWPKLRSIIRQKNGHCWLEA